jgi:hypothetical protein
MRLPRLRFTLRTLIAVVAVIAAEYRALAEDHAGIEQTLRTMIEKSGPDFPVDLSPGNGLRSKRFTAQAVADHEAALRLKYERAAGYPWLPIEPDPPEPVPP